MDDRVLRGMEVSMKKIALFCMFVLLFPMFASFAGCGGASIVLAKAGEKTEYKIVYQGTVSSEMRQEIIELVDLLNDRYDGASFSCVPTYSNKEVTVDTPEILIGDTNRAESRELRLRLTGSEQYAIKAFANGRIAIFGTTEEQLVKALSVFEEKFLKGKALKVSSSFELVEGEGESAEWRLSLPEYGYGIYARNAYDDGPGKDPSTFAKDGKMQVISETTAEEFNAYVKTLLEEGYQQVEKTERNGNIFFSAQNGKGDLMYAYFLSALKEARVIEDRLSMPETEFEYTCEDGPIAYYQYAMMYDKENNGSENDDPYWGNGMFNIIRLADNKLILIDGGDNRQATKDATKELVAFMREITGNATEKIDIACYYLTHPHNDHTMFMKMLLSYPEFSEQINVERMMYNAPADDMSAIIGLAKSMNEKFPNLKFLKPHTGQIIQLGNLSMEVMFTHEDFVDYRGISLVTDFNNYSTVLKLDLNGKSLMLTGDWSGAWGKAPSEYYEGEYRMFAMHVNAETGYHALKSDAIQIAHHAFNPYLGPLHKEIAAKYGFFPCGDVERRRNKSDAILTNITQFLNYGGSSDTAYFASRYTYCMAVDESGDVTIAAQAIRGVDTGDNPSTGYVEVDYVKDVIGAYAAFRVPTDEEFANWELIH